MMVRIESHVVRYDDTFCLPTGEDSADVRLDTFEMGLSWQDTAFSFDGGPKGLGTMMSLTLNQASHKKRRIGYRVKEFCVTKLVLECGPNPSYFFLMYS